MEDIWRKNTKEVAEEYANPNRFGFGNGSYFYDDFYGPDYYIQEQKRLKDIIQKMKPKPEPDVKLSLKPDKNLQSQINKLKKRAMPRVQKTMKKAAKVIKFFKLIF